MTTQPTTLPRIWDDCSIAGAMTPAAKRWAAALDHAPMFPPPVPAVSRADMTAAYDAACKRFARDESPADRDEARRLGTALD